MDFMPQARPLWVEGKTVQRPVGWATMSREQQANLGMGGKVGRAGRSWGQIWQVPTFFVGLLAFVAVAVSAPLRQDTSRLEFEEDLAQLRYGLEQGQEKAAVLIAQAENLLGRLTQFSRKAGEIHFLAGAAYFRQAETCTPDCKDAARDKAVNHFEEALALQVGSADMHPLMYRLGLTLYLQGRERQRALDLMAQAVDKGADRPSKGYALLVQAYLEGPRPNLDAALAANQKQLELTDDRHAEEMAQARLTRGELLLRKEQRLEALKELDRVRADASPPLRIKARLLQTRICEEEGLWNRAIPLWKDLLKDADKVPGGKARVLYALGLCHANGDRPAMDKAIAAWQEAMSLGGDEGQAAGLRLGEVKLFGPTEDAKAGLEIWAKAVEKIRTPNDYRNKVLELSRARELFETACRHFLEAQDFERAQQVAELYKKLAPPGVAEETIAQAAEGQARDLKDQAAPLSGPEAKAKLAEARTFFHRAGVGYEQAALARGDKVEAEVFWRSAQCYVAAQDFPRAGVVLDKFVQLDKNEKRLAEAWLSLAEAHLAQGNKDKAWAAYYKCTEFPATPFAYRARYQLALEEIDKKNYPQALDILKQNLGSSSPQMDREAHENSLYKYARLLLQLQIYDKAVIYLKEASQQYPNNPDVLGLRDQLGDCYRRLAERANVKLNAAESEEAKTHHRRDRQQWLDQAGVTYQGIADELEGRFQTAKTLAPAELWLLRKALFGAAAVRFDMNEFTEALRRYQVLQEKYRKKAEGLIACKHIWECVGVMVETPEQTMLARTAALAAWKQAQADLEAMPADSPDFTGAMGVWTKEQWQIWLRWVGDQLQPATAPPIRPGPVVD